MGEGQVKRRGEGGGEEEKGRRKIGEVRKRIGRKGEGRKKEEEERRQTERLTENIGIRCCLSNEQLWFNPRVIFGIIAASVQ